MYSYIASTALVHTVYLSGSSVLSLHHPEKDMGRRMSPLEP